MKRKTRHFKREYALELLRVADADLNSSRKHFLFLKAVICAIDKPAFINRNLAELIQELPSNSSFADSLEIDELTSFATSQRYEEGKIIFPDDDVMKDHNIAKLIFDSSEIADEVGNMLIEVPNGDVKGKIFAEPIQNAPDGKQYQFQCSIL